MTKPIRLTRPIHYIGQIPKACCADFDENCESIKNKLSCWLYDATQGQCPFIKTNTGTGEIKKANS